MKFAGVTRNQLEKLSKEELIAELITVNSIDEELASDMFLEKYVQVQSELQVSRNCTKLLSKQIEILQRNSLDLWQYFRREMIEINLVPDNV